MTDELNITVEERRAIVAAGRELGRRYPSLLCGLNVAQFRAVRSIYTIDPKTGRRPRINVISFANGCGKTHLLVLDMIGWTMGSDYLDRAAFPQEAIDFYDSLAARRDKGQLSLRILCDANDMREGGSMAVILQEQFPHAQLKMRDQLGVYKQVDIPHPTIPGIVNHIAVKTFDQSKVKHSGSTCQQIWINEPPTTDDIMGETLGRIRTKDGETPGAISMFATLLDSCSWVSAMEDDPDSGLNHQRGHIYENVVGKDVTDTMAREVQKTIDVTLAKNPKGGYVTGGILNAETVKGMIKDWEKVAPHEVEARKCGAPIAVGGKIYPHFNLGVHVVENYKVNPDWPVIQVVDPHSARPSYSIWAQVTPHNKLYIFAEWPGGGNYEALTERRYTIPQETEIWAKLESEFGIKGKVMRVGDPNRFREPDPYTNKTLRDNYSRFGFDFDTNVSDDLQVGHEAVNLRLHCDAVRLAVNPDDTAALPKMFITANCRNTITALKNYAFKKGRKADASVTESVNPKYKDGADVVRYLCMYHDNKDFVKLQDRGDGDSDYALFSRGRAVGAYASGGTFANGFNGSTEYGGYSSYADTYNKYEKFDRFKKRVA